MAVSLPLAALTDWIGFAGLAFAIIGLGAAWLQLRSTAASSRVQATIQFQRAFRDSQPARTRLQQTFPIHETVAQTLIPPDAWSDFKIWKSLDELTPDEKEDAKGAINALNDVAQYVVDGLPLRSALQQYHTTFVRMGILLGPYLDQKNAPREGSPQARYGRRVVDLYNAGLSYHRCHPKHKGRELVLERPSVAGSGMVQLRLMDKNGMGAQEHPGFADETAQIPRFDPQDLKKAVRDAERELRRW